MRKWSHGCFTLLRDDRLGKKPALEANLFISVSEQWSQEHGGFISYIAKDEDEEVSFELGSVYSSCTVIFVRVVGVHHTISLFHGYTVDERNSSRNSLVKMN